MKKYMHFLYALVCVILLTFSACTQSHKTDSSLEPKEFGAQAQSQQGILLDVRTPEEFNEGHLADARNIDYKDDAFKASLEQLDKNKSYFVYCKGGVRSQKAAEIMQEMGFTKVFNLEGGIDAWKEDGLPLNN